MTIPDELTVLRAAIEICDENDGAATAEAIAERLGVDKEIVVLKLLPPIAKYFENVLRGDDGVAVVRQPTAEARRFVGPVTRTMPDEPLYDPDRTVPGDLDFTGPDVALAYINHPTIQKLTYDIGRSFRSMPASHQQRELSEHLTAPVAQRAQVAAGIEDLDPDALGRPALRQLLDDLDGYIEAARLRMLELD